MLLRERYQNDLSLGVIRPDDEQQQMVVVLDELMKKIAFWQQQGFWSRWLLGRMHFCPKGWYCFGNVGAGKTYLMDLCYESLKSPRKYRCHFHAFMRDIHQKLQHLQGRKNPLQKIADDLITQFDVIFFDEFMVHDIADAMLLGELLKALFSRGIVLLATSNAMPDDLYPNGLQRARFLPAITLIKENTQVIHLDVLEDYRLQNLKKYGVYFSPLTAETNLAMEKCFLRLTSSRGKRNLEIEINGRLITARGLSAEVLWFDFKTLCTLGRSQHDYLWIAESYHTLLLGNMPQLREIDSDISTLFAYLVDILYDAKVKLILQVAVDVDFIFEGKSQRQKYQRVISRLHEMQSEEYLHKTVHGV